MTWYETSCSTCSYKQRKNQHLTHHTWIDSQRTPRGNRTLKAMKMMRRRLSSNMAEDNGRVNEENPLRNSAGTSFWQFVWQPLQPFIESGSLYGTRGLNVPLKHALGLFYIHHQTQMTENLFHQTKTNRVPSSAKFCIYNKEHFQYQQVNSVPTCEDYLRPCFLECQYFIKHLSPELNYTSWSATSALDFKHTCTELTICMCLTSYHFHVQYKSAPWLFQSSTLHNQPSWTFELVWLFVHFWLAMTDVQTYTGVGINQTNRQMHHLIH